MLASRPPSRRGRIGIAGIAIPAIALIVGVVLIRSTGAHVLAYAGAIGTPLLAAAGRWRLPLAAALWVLAWRTDGLVAQAASVALIALAAITVARLIARAALRREESRGGHFRSDFPRRDDRHWMRHLVDVRAQ